MSDEEPAKASTAPSAPSPADLAKFKTAAIAAGAAFLAVLGTKLQDGAAGRIADTILARFDNDTFLVTYSVQQSALPEDILVTAPGSKEALQILDPDKKGFVAKGPPGTYTVKLTRIEKGQTLVCQGHIEIAKDGKGAEFATDTWDPPDSLTDFTPQLSHALNDTRYNTVPADFALQTSASDGMSRRILVNALNQVGVDSATPTGRSRVADYLATFHLKMERDPERVPWGGALLGWVADQSGVQAPSAAPSFSSWSSWGSYVDPNNARPGMMAIFKLVGDELPQAKSRLLVGVFLKQQSNCTEAIIGNINGRVSISCIQRELVAVRRAPSEPVEQE